MCLGGARENEPLASGVTPLHDTKELVQELDVTIFLQVAYSEIMEDIFNKI